MMGSVFAMQGIGQFAAGVMSLIVTVGFKESLLSAAKVSECSGVCGIAVDKMWRVVIGFGAVPGCIALYYRLTIPETPRYTFDVSRDVVKAGSDVKAYLSSSPEGIPDEITRVNEMRDSAPRMEIPKASWSDFIHHYGQWKYGKILLGTAGSWFFLDVAFYGVGLNNATILQAIGYAKGDSVYKVFYNISVGNLILVCAGAIPGYWVTVATVDTVGRKPIQLGGFIILTIASWASVGYQVFQQSLKHRADQITGYHKIGENGLLACYVIAQFFFNFGPNSTTFIVPGECKQTPSHDSQHHESMLTNLPRLPNPLPLHLPRHLRRLRQSRLHHRPSPHRSPPHPRRHRQKQVPLAQPRHADLRSLHASRLLHHSSDP
jgi:PHS family inorganic phosphate transporter-like MFS transporter